MDGLLKLLHVATQIPEQCEYPVSSETRQHLAICLSRLNDDMVFDNRRAVYKERVDAFFNSLMEKLDDPRTRVKMASLLITLLQGPFDVGMNLVTNDQITAMMLEMAASEDRLHQSISAELIVQTVSKHERATTMLKDDNVKVRALMGLCKCASAGGDDASRQTMQEGSTLKLAQTCKKFLLDVNRYSVDVRSEIVPIGDRGGHCRFACEGLSYLSLDADVKEWIAEDPLLLQALLSLAKTAGSLCVYTLASIYVNLTNSYEKPKIDEELVKLAQVASSNDHLLSADSSENRFTFMRIVCCGTAAICCGHLNGAAVHTLLSKPGLSLSSRVALASFAKHHVPETHPKDTDDCVERRVRLLVKDGATAACVAVSKTESKNALELLARALLAFTEFKDLRGQILSEGGAKLLLRLTKEATPEGKIKAAHAIARLGSEADPTIAFPGQRAYEVVKPLAELLHPDIEGRPNYDALLTLTNLASVSDSIRRRIIKEKVIPKAEEYWFMTDHKHLRAAAAELFLNLLFCEEFLKHVIKNKERVGAQKEAQRALDAAVKWGIIKPSEREIYEKSTGVSTIPEE
uniref:UNC-45/Cro1/She4 central domain-containing protein n=1 Tax=Parascaris equorum TaxID=6256 RepID=A0A914S8L0_PAREQ